jgi:hypothetical protein
LQCGFQQAESLAHENLGQRPRKINSHIATLKVWDSPIPKNICHHIYDLLFSDKLLDLFTIVLSHAYSVASVIIP